MNTLTSPQQVYIHQLKDLYSEETLLQKPVSPLVPSFPAHAAIEFDSATQPECEFHYYYTECV